MHTAVPPSHASSQPHVHPVRAAVPPTEPVDGPEPEPTPLSELLSSAARSHALRANTLNANSQQAARHAHD